MNQHLLTRAYLVAARAHAGQTRKGKSGLAYVNHPIEVAALVAREGADAETIAAAVLHDVLEDSEVTAAELRAEFGERVAALVEALTDDPAWAALSAPERKALQAAHAPRMPGEARMIKIADQLSNLRDIAREPEAWKPERALAYIEASQRVVAACREAAPALAGRFDAAVEAAREAVTGRR